MLEWTEAKGMQASLERYTGRPVVEKCIIYFP